MVLVAAYPVAVVSDATAAAKLHEGDGYAAAMINFRYLANTVWTTSEAEKAIQAGSRALRTAA